MLCNYAVWMVLTNKLGDQHGYHSKQVFGAQKLFRFLNSFLIVRKYRKTLRFDKLKALNEDAQ